MNPRRRSSLKAITGAMVWALSPGLHANTRSRRVPTVFRNGDILTMEAGQPAYVESLVEQDGKIAFVGTLREAQRRFPGATSIDLNGKTLLPGFVDGHGHLYLTGLTGLMCDVSPPPDGGVSSFEDLVGTTRAWMESAAGKAFIGTFGWIVANGYDDAQLREGLHPTASVLDRVSRDLPVLAIHQSGHVGCLNTVGLAAAGYSASSAPAEGGGIGRFPDGSLNGLVEEAAYNKVAFAILAKSTPAVAKASIAKGQAAYLAGGYTTAQEARALPGMTAALAGAANNGELYLDVIAYPDLVMNSQALASPQYSRDGKYSGRFRIGGAKLSLDGSPQAKTAWLSHPYHVAPHGAPTGYRGYPALPEDKVRELVRSAFESRVQLLCHANGDAAIDQFLDAVEAATNRHAYADHRSVLVHGQVMRADQVSRMARLGVLPSLFPAHTYYWGDFHRDSVLGAERAGRISPCRDVLRAGLTLTTHHDAPVIKPSAMRILDAAVNRVTRSGFVLGGEQALTPYEGLQTLTSWAAKQCFEEATKGTLTVGKVADLVVLSDNPLRVPPRRIHHIAIDQVFKEGQPCRASGEAAGWGRNP